MPTKCFSNSKSSDEQPRALTIGEKEFGDEIDVPFFPTARILSRGSNLKLLVQL